MIPEEGGVPADEEEINPDSEISQTNTWGQVFLKEYATSKAEELKKPRDIVVSFPEGQKLTIRDLEPGTIVEVAAWKGKGRPGDEAVRMLFGANSPGDDEPSSQDELSHDNSYEFVQDSEIVMVDQLNKDPGFDEAMGSRPTPHMVDHTVIRTRQNSRGEKTGRREGMVKRIAWSAGIILVLVGLVLGLRATNILHFEHPSSGVKTGLGDANSSVFAITPGGDLEPGSTIVALIDGEKVAVSVIQMAEENLLVSSGSGQRVIVVSDVLGRVVFVVPFIGYLAGAF